MSELGDQNDSLTPLQQPLFQNSHVIIIDKPAGWLTVPSRQGAEDTRPSLGRALEKMCTCRIFPVHRLDGLPRELAPTRHSPSDVPAGFS